MEAVIKIDRLKPYFELAQEVAKTSDCIRRQYGAVVAGDDFYVAKGANTRVSKCCKGTSCARNRFHIQHGQRVEVGGEIHAEIATLLQAGGMRSEHTQFILVGYSGDNELYGTNVYPCHQCATALKYAGYSHIYIRHNEDNIVPVSVADILAFREQEWEFDS